MQTARLLFFFSCLSTRGFHLDVQGLLCQDMLSRLTAKSSPHTHRHSPDVNFNTFFFCVASARERESIYPARVCWSMLLEIDTRDGFLAEWLRSSTLLVVVETSSPPEEKKKNGLPHLFGISHHRLMYFDSYQSTIHLIRTGQISQYFLF